MRGENLGRKDERRKVEMEVIEKSEWKENINGRRGKRMGRGRGREWEWNDQDRKEKEEEEGDVNESVGEGNGIGS